MGTYDKKGKLTGRQISTIKSLDENSDVWVANMNVQVYDKKDKEKLNNDIEIECENGTMKMDLSRFFPPDLIDPEKDDVTDTSENLEWPADLEQGMSLPDGSVNTDMGLIKVLVEIKNRKVLGEETITTKAGTFECQKVGYTSHLKAVINKEYEGVYYVAKNAGVVRSETIDKKGNIKEYTELINISGN